MLKRPASTCFSEPNDVFLGFGAALTIVAPIPPSSAMSARPESRVAPAETPATAMRRRRDIPIDPAFFIVSSLFPPFQWNESSYCVSTWAESWQRGVFQFALVNATAIASPHTGLSVELKTIECGAAAGG
jgi:hypothetical protein